MFVVSATVTLDHNIFKDNRSIGLFIWYGKAVTLTENLFENNVDFPQIRGMSTVIYQAEQAIIQGNDFINNPGGGLAIRATHVLVNQNNFVGNGCCVLEPSGGAGISAYYGVISNNTFIGNRGDNGGGISSSSSEGTAYGGSYITITNNLILDNTAGRGGGIFLSSFRGILINNVITDNHVLYNHSRASGIRVKESKVTIVHSTISNNTGGDGSGIFADMTVSYITITNSIVSDQLIGIYLNSEYNKATVDSTLWFNNAVNTSGSGTFTITNPFQGDPVFMADGYHIGLSSAAIDKGVSTFVTEDIDGTPRPVGIAPDLGADEFPELTEWLYLPVLFFLQ